MEFKIVDDGNIQIVLMNNGEELAKATCYYTETPEVEGQRIGTIGEFETKNQESGIIILEKCEEVLKEKGVKLIVAPMNGNTWKKYRTLKYSNGEPTFLMENVNPKEHNEILLKAGFEELHTYTSTKGLIKDTYESESLDIIENNLEEANIVIRKFNKEEAINDLKKIYNVSVESFSRNPLYTPIGEKEFLKQYEPYINMVDDELILIAEKEGKEVGFVFCIPDFNQLKIEGKLNTLILKTIAVLPEYENLAIGNIMLRHIAKKAQSKNFEKWIFAFMYSNNTSQKMAKRNKTEVIREYVLYGKKIKK